MATFEPMDAAELSPEGSSGSPAEAAEPAKEGGSAPAPPTRSYKQNRGGQDLTELRELASHLATMRRSRMGELPSESRIAIVTAVACGISRGAVADAFGISNHTVRTALDRWENRHSTASRPRSGRPKKLTPDDELAIVRATRDEQQTSRTLATTYSVSRGTIRRVLKMHRVQEAADAEAQVQAAKQAAAAEKAKLKPKPKPKQTPKARAAAAAAAAVTTWSAPVQPAQPAQPAEQPTPSARPLPQQSMQGIEPLSQHQHHMQQMQQIPHGLTSQLPLPDFHGYNGASY